MIIHYSWFNNDLFKDHVRSSEYVEFNGRMFDELLTESVLKTAAYSD
jgi:hypothetical protein